MLKVFLIAGASYLLGSIPFGYLLVRVFRGEDVRKSGSGNIGATNVSRKSPLLGVLTLLLDAAKGFVAVELATIVVPAAGMSLSQLMAICALLAIAGHMFPLWLGFRGGKGVATALGAFARFAPLAVLVAVVVFVAVVALTRRISLGSILTATLFPVSVWVLNLSHDPLVITAVSIAALLIIVRHRQNIRRLISGDEPRFSFSHRAEGRS
jgi:glycerol-3-phosphate acyltransferase PlsY